MAVENTRTLEQWKTLIDAAHASGLSRKEWCEQNGINHYAMSGAVKRSRKKASSSARATRPKAGKEPWAAVEPAALPVLPDAPLTLDWRGLTLTIPATYPVSGLAALLGRLAR